MIVVSDTSPITSLLAIERIDLLKKLYDEVTIPPAVKDELEVCHSNLPAFLRVMAPKNNERVRVLTSRLDPGEAEAIVVASELHADCLLMDETLGRSVAREEDIPVIGLVGILLLAKERGMITNVGDILDALKNQAGFYLADNIRIFALKNAGESVKRS